MEEKRDSWRFSSDYLEINVLAVTSSDTQAPSFPVKRNSKHIRLSYAPENVTLPWSPEHSLSNIHKLCI